MLDITHYKALWAYCEGIKLSRPVRRKLIANGLLDEFGPTDRGLGFLIYHAPRSKWEAPALEYQTCRLPEHMREHEKIALYAKKHLSPRLLAAMMAGYL